MVPPPQQKTLVYVLNKKSEAQDQGLIEVPFTPQQPEVYYVNYAEGENPSLPGGIDLQTALANSRPQQGQDVAGGGRRPQGGRPSGGNTFGSRPTGGNSFGPRPSGGNTFGSRPTGGNSFGSRPTGGRPNIKYGVPN